MDYEKIIIEMKNFFENFEKDLDSLKKDESKYNFEQLDLLHYIENNNLNASGYSKVGKALKELRKDRRIIKNKIEKMEAIQKLVRKYNNKFILQDLIQTLKELNIIKKQHNEPIYRNRTEIVKEKLL